LRHLASGLYDKAGFSEARAFVNIGLVIFNADPARGGAEGYTAQLAAALAARGHSVELIAARFGQLIPGVQFVPIAVSSPRRSGQYAQFLDRLDSRLQARRPEIVHSMLPVRQCDVYHPHAGMAKASYALRWTNRFNTKRRLYARTEETLLTGPIPPKVLCLSDYVKTSILKTYPELAPRLEKLFNAVDLNRFDPKKYASAKSSMRQKYRLSADRAVALMIAQHFEQKGLPQTLEAMVGITELSLVVVGKDDPARGAMAAYRLGLGDRAIFAGQTDNPGDFYAAADFFVLPTRHDSCSLVVLEALAMGLPVISTAFNGACEIMTNGREGFVLPDPGDVPALADAMKQLLDPRLRKSMGEAALALRPALSFETHLDRLEEIYKSIRPNSR
jgi:UDP-glucose:(heptosyl)LPS alpha-1,3-glucosyltransferase